MPVVNACTEEHEIYAGQLYSRPKDHYGNPFADAHYPGCTVHKEVKTGTGRILVGSYEQAVDYFKQWLLEEGFLDVEPERRAWVQTHMQELVGKRIGVPFGITKEMRYSHAHFLEEMAIAMASEE
jgi:hypothetical protein